MAQQEGTKTIVPPNSPERWEESDSGVPAGSLRTTPHTGGRHLVIAAFPRGRDWGRVGQDVPEEIDIRRKAFLASVEEV